MRVSVLASGSKGNSTYVEIGDCKVLIDLGTTSRYAEDRLIELGIEPRLIDCIFLTHTHVDHVSGLKTFLKKYHPTVYLTPKMYEELRLCYSLPHFCFLEDAGSFPGFSMEFFKTSHDSSDSVGYILGEKSRSLVYLTDVGYIPEKNFSKLSNHTMYVMESNHDIEMLMDGKYPYQLKQRVLGDKGHLSNRSCAEYLTHFIGEKTEKVILIHLSQDNNTEVLANDTLQAVLKSHHQSLQQLVISKQGEKTELVEV